MSSTVVKLSVGGVRFETTLATLTRDEDSMLATMFSGRWELPLNEDGCTFIDRDGSLFGYILNYLRGCPSLPRDRYTMDRLYDEAVYFGLTGLIAAINKDDMNSRNFKLNVQSEHFPMMYHSAGTAVLPISCLRREKNSQLSILVTEMYEKHGHNQIGDLVLNEIHPRVKIPSTNLPIVLGNIFYEIDKRHKHNGTQTAAYRLFLNTCVFHTIVDYLKTGKLIVDFSEVKLRTVLIDEMTRLKIQVLPRNLNIDRNEFISKILLPMVASFAEYYGFAELLKDLKELRLSSFQ